MALIIADSDVLIDALRGREPAASQIRRALQRRELATTAISVFELHSGVSSSGASQQVTALLAPLEVFPFSTAAARRAAKIRLILAGRGSGIGMADYLIAGICLEAGATLFTRNRAHFERVDGLVLFQG